MKLHKKALNADQVKQRLIKAAAKQNAANQKRLAESKRKYGYAYEVKEVTYRNVAHSAYKVKAGVFEAKKWTFNPKTLEARSFHWWSMLTVIKGKLVRNAHNYSQATTHHQKGLDRCLDALGIKPDVVLHVRSNIAHHLGEAETEIMDDWAKAVLLLKYGRKSNAKWRKTRVRRLEREMENLRKQKIGMRFTKKAMAEALKAAEIKRAETLLWKREQRKKAIAPALPTLSLVGG